MPYIGKKPADIIATSVNTDTGAFSGNVTAGGTLGVTGETTLATHLNLGDSDEIKLGAGVDLKVFSDGTNGVLRADNGRVYIQTDTGVNLTKTGNAETMLIATPDGSVDLYHNNVKTFSTTTTGIDVIGTANSTLNITAGGTSNDSLINFVHGSTTDGGITYDHNGAYASEQMQFRTGNNTPNMTLTGAGALTVANGLTLTDGNLVVASGHGIDFSATANTSSGSMSSELLSDYEEGTWTPTIFNGSSTLTTVNSGSTYTKIGRLVNLEFYIRRNDSSSDTSVFQISGFPFASSSSVRLAGQAWIDNASNDIRCFMYMAGGESKAYMLKAGASDAYVSINELANARYVYGSLTYHT